MRDVYSSSNRKHWAGAAPFRHASGIWGRGKLIEHAAKCVRRGDVVIDLGCGAGLPTSYFAPMVGDQGIVRGYDNSRPLIEEAKELESTFSNLEFSVVDVCRGLPAADSSVDWFLSFMLIQNLRLRDISRLFEECTRCLRPTGGLLFLTLHPNFFEEEWDLSFIKYDSAETNAWRRDKAGERRIDGVLDAVGNGKKPVFAYPHTLVDIHTELSANDLRIESQTEIQIDEETAIKKFGANSIGKMPKGPLFWIFRARKTERSRGN